MADLDNLIHPGLPIGFMQQRQDTLFAQSHPVFSVKPVT